MNILLTELSWSVWKNLDLSRVYRPHCVRPELTTSVKILPYRPPAWLIRAKYHQNFDIAMGTPFAVTVANTFMYYHEWDIVKMFSRSLLLYKHFIDDIFVIWDGPCEIFLEFLHAISTKDQCTVEPRSTDTRFIRTPRYYGQFRFPRRKAHIFFLKSTRLLRTPVNTDNGHFSVSRATNSYTLSTPLYGHCLYLCIVYCHCHDYVLIRDFVPWSNSDRFRRVSTILLRNETVAK